MVVGVGFCGRASCRPRSAGGGSRGRGACLVGGGCTVGLGGPGLGLRGRFAAGGGG